LSWNKREVTMVVVSMADPLITEELDELD